MVKVLQSAGHDLHAWITETQGTFSSTSESVLTWQFERLRVTTQPLKFFDFPGIQFTCRTIDMEWEMNDLAVSRSHLIHLMRGVAIWGKTKFGFYINELLTTLPPMTVIICKRRPFVASRAIIQSTSLSSSVLNVHMVYALNSQS